MSSVLTISTQVEALDELCAVGSMTFHIHGERHSNGGPPTVPNIG